MATCANCLHHSLCDYNTNISGNGKVRLVYAEGADVKCSFFKNTADVVPKSEVARLEKELDDFTVASLAECRACGEKTSKVIAGLQEKLSKSKADVAREIFEEIENSISPMLGLEDDKEYVAILATTFAELKKKYTDGKNENT